MSKTGRAVVFGGAGFIGSHVADKLSEKGYEVLVFDLKRSDFLRPDQQMLEGSILDQEQVLEAVGGADVVYNFAGHADLDTASTNPIRTAELNLLGNLHVVEACIKQSVRQFVYASTIYVYSEAGGFYRCSKQAAEIFIEEYNRKHNLCYTILRYGSLYGPRADERNSVFRYIRQAIDEGRIVLKGKGDEIREYVHVRDAAKVSARVTDPQYYNKRFVITGHQSIPVERLMIMIQEILGRSVEIQAEATSGADHYRVTPYSFVPKIGEKFAPDIFTDMGQGLIECMADMTERGVVSR